MASVVCKACKERIDRAAATCPHCGERVPRAWEFPLIALGVAGAIGGVAWYLGNTTFKKPPPPAVLTAEQKQAVEAAREIRDENLLRVCAFRKTQKSVETFTVVKVVRREDNALCLHFTTKNNFGSDVSERWTLFAIEAMPPQRTGNCDNVAGIETTASVANRLRYCPD